MSNIIQEVSAKIYWCPVRPVRCKGSACMAWRYADGAKEERGFCGLATSPFKIGECI